MNDLEQIAAQLDKDFPLWPGAFASGGMLEDYAADCIKDPAICMKRLRARVLRSTVLPIINAAIDCGVVQLP